MSELKVLGCWLTALARRSGVAVLFLVTTASASVCANASAPTTTGEMTLASAVTPPPVDGRVDYQIGGAYRPGPSVRVVDRDRHEEPVAGLYNICYVNAFQTQPEDARFWTRNHRDLLVQRGGRLVADPDWPGEYLLDTSTQAKRRALLAIVGPWVDGCAHAGYQAVEPDNLDSWSRSRGALTPASNLAFVTLLAQRAHALGLAIGQKNGADLGAAGRTRAHLDFAIAEECQHYRECGAYTAAYGAHVIEIEYTDASRRYFTQACAAQGRSISVLLRDRDVLPAGSRGYHDEAC